MFDPQTSVPGNRNNAKLENLRPDTPYSITVEPFYPEGPGAELSGNGRTRKIQLSLPHAPPGVDHQNFCHCRLVSS